MMDAKALQDRLFDLLGTDRSWWYVIDCNPFGDPRQPKWEIRKIHGSAYVWSGSRFATFDAARLHAIELVEQWRQSPYAIPRRSCGWANAIQVVLERSDHPFTPGPFTPLKGLRIAALIEDDQAKQ